MTLPGGPADKVGNRYEKWWTLSEFIRMLRGDTNSLCIEDPEVQKADLVVTRGGRRELHQVKHSHPNGKWSLAALRSNGLLHSIGRQLAGNEDRFVFASGSEAHELSDLCESASGAESVKEFEQAFLAAQGRKRQFRKLYREDWKCDVAAAFERLRRIEVRTIDEREIQRTVRWGVQALFFAAPSRVVAELWRIAEESVHRTISRQALVEELEGCGYRLRRLTNPESAGIAVELATRQYLDGGRNKLIRRKFVPRAEARKLLSRIEKTTAESVVTGSAGSGKTACVVEVAERLLEQGRPVLAFRLDHLPPVPNTTRLGERLGLEESPVLVLAAAAEAAGRPGVLIVDQLDAVSTMSGRTSGALDLVERLLQEARGARARAGIHIIVVCRAFDWRHDPHLRQLVPVNDPDTEVEVTGFPAAEVEAILSEAGFDARLFQPRQIELLRLPQNLALYLEAGFDSSGAPVFDTAKELFDRYWDEKRRSVAERVAPSPDQWMGVMRALCDEMTAERRLSVPTERLDGFQPDYLKQLASEGVLAFDRRRYGFGHESFFDYCFARMFRARSESLVSFLVRSEQHLFQRAQVRQVLVYLRDADPARYVRELGELLANEQIRAHIKDLAFSLLAGAAEPTSEEWNIWEQFTAAELEAIRSGIRSPDKLSTLAWQRLFESSSWFAFVDSSGTIEEWLDSGNERLADLAVNYLSFQLRHAPDRVATLLEPYADRGGEWARRLRTLMGWDACHTSRRLFDLFLRLVDNGTLDDSDEHDTFADATDELVKRRAEWVPELLAHWLRHRIESVRDARGDLSQPETLGYDRDTSMVYFEAAKNAPAKFVEYVLPAVLEISDSTLISDGLPPTRDAVWPCPMNAECGGVADAFPAGSASALFALARQGAANVSDLAADLRRRDSYIANYLLLALYTGGAARYADEAAALLCKEPWRFDCGFTDSPRRFAMETIRAIVQHCTPGNRERLEATILGYVHPSERTHRGFRSAGWARFALLSAMPAAQRSARANAHFRELERKFGEPEDEPRESIGGIVESPIEKASADKMTDDQWLRAIEIHRYENGLYDPDYPLRGGARELADVLKMRVWEEPDRFARLSLRFPENANPVYLDRTLSGLKDAAIDSDLMLQVCRKAFSESSGSCGRSLAEVLANMAHPLPDEAVRMLHSLATEREEPAREVWQEDADSGRAYWNGINTTRAQAADAVRDLVLADADYIGRFRPTLERMVRDRSAAVLSCVAGAVRAVATHDPEFGFCLFQSLDLSDERLLATPHVYRFIRENLHDRFADLRPIVERMLRSRVLEVCEAGARLATMAVLTGPVRAEDLADEALRGHAPQRLGVAQVASANVGVPEYRAQSEEMLVTLFDDADADVRREAGSCFRHLHEESLDTYEGLIASFCASRAYREDSFSILHALEESLGRLPGMTCMVCERFLDRFDADARDVRTGRTADDHTVSKLIFRTYQQHQNDEWAARSLELIDRLCLERIGGVEDELAQFDR